MKNTIYTDHELMEARETWLLLTRPYIDMLVEIYSMARPIGIVIDGNYSHVEYGLTPDQQRVVSMIKERLNDIKKDFQCLEFLPLEP